MTRNFGSSLQRQKDTAGEVRSQLYVALDADFLNEAKFNELTSLTAEIGRLLAGFMTYLGQSELRGNKYKQDEPAKS